MKRLQKFWNDPERIKNFAIFLLKMRGWALGSIAIVSILGGLYYFGALTALLACGPQLLKYRHRTLLARIREELVTSEHRPRFGTLVRADGDEIPLVFHPSDNDPFVFYGYHAGDESVVTPEPDDELRVDCHMPGQAIVLGVAK